MTAVTTRRFIIYGAGAMGGVLGAELFEQGVSVELIARGAHLDAIAERGLRYVTPQSSTTLQIPVVGHPRQIEFREDDVVVIAVKSQDSATVLDALYDVAPPSVSILCFQNGVSNEDVALRYFANVYGVCISSPTEHVTPGVVTSFASPAAGLLRIGRYPGGEDGVAKELGDVIGSTRYLVQVFSEVQRWKYTKLLENLVNVLQALLEPGAGSSITNIARGEGVAAAIGGRARNEGMAVLEVAGIDYVPFDEFKKAGAAVVARAVDGAERVGASMHQSLARGLQTVETDFLNGEIVRLGRLHRVPTPVNAFLQYISHEAVRNRIPPGSIAQEDFVSQLASYEASLI